MKLKTQHQIDDKVNFHPMYKHQVKYGITEEESNGRVIAIKFTKLKVLYTIVDDYYGYIFDDVDSVKVFKIE